MNNGPLLILLIVILIMAGVGFYIYTSSSKGSSSSTPSSSTSSGSSSEPNPIITAESSAPPSCTLSPSISGTSLTYYLVQGADTDISSGASVTYDPSTNPRLLTLTNSGNASGGQITITNICGDIKRITGILTLRQIDYSLTIIPGSLLYINQYAFNVDRYASNTPPPPSYGGSGGIPGYTRKGASGDVQGFDITGPSIQVITPQACAKACDDIDSCLGFSIDLNNTVCNLKAAEYNGTTNINQAQTVSYYSKDKNTLPKRYFVLYNSGTNKWLTIRDASGGYHLKGNHWYYMGYGTGVYLRDASNYRFIPGQSVWYYNSSKNQFVSALSPNWVLSYETNGNMSIRKDGTTGFDNSMYYSTTKGGGTKQIVSQNSKILSAEGTDGVNMKTSVTGLNTTWELVYLPTPKISASLPSGFDWNVVFLLRTKLTISTHNNRYGYLCAPQNSLDGTIGCTGKSPVSSRLLSCIYDDSDFPYNNPGAIWSCYGQTSTYATIYIRSFPELCMQGGENNGSQVYVINSCRDPGDRNDFTYIGFLFTSDGLLQCGKNYMKLDSSLNTFSLTSDKGTATPIVCVQINPMDLNLNNYKTNEPEIF
jgi:hypothetical protein